VGREAIDRYSVDRSQTRRCVAAAFGSLGMLQCMSYRYRCVLVGQVCYHSDLASSYTVPSESHATNVHVTRSGDSAELIRLTSRLA
jgi:hypothetical protein